MPLLRPRMAPRVGPRPHLQLGAALAPRASRAQSRLPVHRRGGGASRRRQRPHGRQPARRPEARIRFDAEVEAVFEDHPEGLTLIQWQLSKSLIHAPEQLIQRPLCNRFGMQNVDPNVLPASSRMGKNSYHKREDLDIRVARFARDSNFAPGISGQLFALLIRRILEPKNKSLWNLSGFTFYGDASGKAQTEYVICRRVYCNGSRLGTRFCPSEWKAVLEANGQALEFQDERVRA